MKINQFDHQNLRTMRAEMEEALKNAGEPYGVTFTMGKITFSGASFKVSIDAVCDPTGVGKDIDALNFERYATSYGLNPSDLGKTIQINFQPYTISGLNPKAHKNVIQIKNRAGKTYVTSVEKVKRELAKLATV
jgi:hypothetical protein